MERFAGELGEEVRSAAAAEYTEETVLVEHYVEGHWGSSYTEGVLDDYSGEGRRWMGEKQERVAN